MVVLKCQLCGGALDQAGQSCTECGRRRSLASLLLSPSPKPSNPMKRSKGSSSPGSGALALAIVVVVAITAIKHAASSNNVLVSAPAATASPSRVALNSAPGFQTFAEERVVKRRPGKSGWPKILAKHPKRKLEAPVAWTLDQPSRPKTELTLVSDSGVNPILKIQVDRH